jgi:hypothetical protein
LPILLMLAGCAGTIMVSPDGRQVVNCGEMAHTAEGVYWSIETLGVSSAVSNQCCVHQLQKLGFLTPDEWQQQQATIQQKEAELRQLWQTTLRPQVAGGQVTALAAVEQLNTREIELFGAPPYYDRLHAVRRILAAAVDEQQLCLPEAELLEVESRERGRLPVPFNVPGSGVKLRAVKD